MSTNYQQYQKDFEVLSEAIRQVLTSLSRIREKGGSSYLEGRWSMLCRTAAVRAFPWNRGEEGASHTLLNLSEVKEHLLEASEGLLADLKTSCEALERSVESLKAVEVSS